MIGKERDWQRFLPFSLMSKKFSTGLQYPPKHLIILKCFKKQEIIFVIFPEAPWEITKIFLHVIDILTS